MILQEIAGPIFRLKMDLKQFIDGKNVEKVYFRQTDFLPGVSTLFTEFLLFNRKRKQLISESEMLLKQMQQANEVEKLEIKKKIKINLKMVEGNND